MRFWNHVRDTSAITEEYLSFPTFFKASPGTEGDKRYLYLEASNQAVDFQNERVLASALQDSADYFLRYGNLDIQHRSMIGLANGDRDYHLHEIGRPEQVKADGTRTYVKGRIFSGDGEIAKCANDFWDSLTRLTPPQRWYPSVAGKITSDKKDIDPNTHRPRRTITGVLWCNVGFSRTPVNPAVPEVSTVPIGVLAKCWGAGGLNLTKALDAGYGTDSATLTGGAALREQSLDRKPQNYWDMRERLAGEIKRGTVAPHVKPILARARSYGIDDDQAGEWAEQFIKDLTAAMQQRLRA